MNNVLQRVTTPENASFRENSVSTRSSLAQSTGLEKEKPQMILPELSVSCVFKLILLKSVQ